MAGWTKLEKTILQSSIWDEPNHVRIVWITLLALQDKDGYVGASVPGIAHEARVSVDEAKHAIETLEAPDPWSRDPDNEGRRIEKVDRGWLILNSKKIRGEDKEEKMRRQARERKRKQRERESADVTPVTPSHVTSRDITQVTHNKNKNKNKKDLPDSSLRSESATSKKILPSQEVVGEKESFLLASPSLTSVDPVGKTPGSRVWKAYTMGYEDKYGIPPRSNAKNYRHCKDLVKRLGESEAAALAEWYPFYRNAYHGQRGHPLECLLKDCETIYTAMVTGHHITRAKAIDDDRRETTRSALEEYLAERDGG